MAEAGRYNLFTTLGVSVRVLAAAVLAASVAVSTGCASPPPPVSQKVQDYYDKNVVAQATARPVAAAQPVVAFLGDSYTAGAGSSASHGWTTLVSKAEGWTEKGFGFGGTNYGSAGSLKGGSAYADRVARVVASKPSIVIVSGGGNDLGADQSEGITATFKSLRKGLPKAQIIALSPFWKAEAMPPELVTVASQIKFSVESVGGQYVDISNPLEGRPELLDPDGVHPNDAGHALIAAEVRAALGPVLSKAKG